MGDTTTLSSSSSSSTPSVLLLGSSSRAHRYLVSDSAFVINEWYLEKRGLLPQARSWVEDVLRPQHEMSLKERMESKQYTAEVLLSPGAAPKLVFEEKNPELAGWFVVQGRVTLKKPPNAWGSSLYQFYSTYAEKIAAYYDLVGDKRLMEEVIRPTRAPDENDEHQLCAHPIIGVDPCVALLSAILICSANSGDKFFDSRREQPGVRFRSASEVLGKREIEEADLGKIVAVISERHVLAAFFGVHTLTFVKNTYLLAWNTSKLDQEPPETMLVMDLPAYDKLCAHALKLRNNYIAHVVELNKLAVWVNPEAKTKAPDVPVSLRLTCVRPAVCGDLMLPDRFYNLEEHGLYRKGKFIVCARNITNGDVIARLIEEHNFKPAFYLHSLIEQLRHMSELRKPLPSSSAAKKEKGQPAKEEKDTFDPEQEMVTNFDKITPPKNQQEDGTPIGTEKGLSGNAGIFGPSKATAESRK